MLDVGNSHAQPPGEDRRSQFSSGIFMKLCQSPSLGALYISGQASSAHRAAVRHMVLGHVHLGLIHRYRQMSIGMTEDFSAPGHCSGLDSAEAGSCFGQIGVSSSDIDGSLPRLVRRALN